jgi:hypothetical protein
MNERIGIGRKMCERLAAAVSAIAPAGIGAWPQAWEVVGPASADFMELLTRWEDTGKKALLPRIRTAYDDVLAAWKRAAEQYERETA